VFLKYNPNNHGEEMTNIYSKNDEDVICDFCGKQSSKVDYLFAGPTVFICDRCVDEMSKVLAVNRKSEMNAT